MIYSHPTLKSPIPISYREILIFFLLLILTPVHANPSNEANPVYAPGNKFALVIGNSDYRVSPLKNPANDSADVAESLKSIGFKVAHIQNLDHDNMMRQITLFGTNLKEGDIGIFYYAGHAVQYNGESFLLPVNSIEKVQQAIDLNREAVSMQTVIDSMEFNGGSANVLILDSCRNSPFTELAEIQSGLSRSQAIRKHEGKEKDQSSLEEGEEQSQRSVVRLAEQPTEKTNAGGILIAYATSPNDVALDGDGDNSPYTRALLNHLKAPSTTLEDILKRTRNEVVVATAGRQTPWYESSITQEVYPSGKGTIEFATLLRHFFEYKTEVERRENRAIGWDVGTEQGFPIEWAHEGVLSDWTIDSSGKRVNPVQQLLKSLRSDVFRYPDSILTDEEAKTFFKVSSFRFGQTILTKTGQLIAGTDLTDQSVPVKWVVVLAGPRCCPTLLQLAVSGIIQDSFVPEEYVLESKALCSAAGYEVESFRIQFPDARPLWAVQQSYIGGTDPRSKLQYYVFYGNNEPTADELAFIGKECHDMQKVRRQFEIQSLLDDGEWREIPGTAWEGSSATIEMGGIQQDRNFYTFDSFSADGAYARIQLDCGNQKYRLLRRHLDDGGKTFYEPIDDGSWMEYSQNSVSEYAAFLCQ